MRDIGWIYSILRRLKIQNDTLVMRRKNKFLTFVRYTTKNYCMKHVLVFFLFFVIFLLCHSCKREIASTHSVLLAADSLMWPNPESVLLLLEQISEPQQLEGADRALYALLMTQARYKCCVLLENDSLVRIAVDYYEDSKEKERLAQSYFYQGCVYVEKQELPEAIELFLQTLDEMPRGKDSIFVAMVYSHLGDCYDEQDLHSTARGAYKRAYNLCAVNDSIRACYTLKNIGDTFLFEGVLDSTFNYYSQGVKVATTLQDSALLSFLYKNIAAVYNSEHKYIEAETYISKALAYLSGEEDNSSVYSIKGDILNNLNQKDSAIYYWGLGTTSPNIYVKTSSFHSLFLEYKELKDWEQAALSADSFIIFYDSIQNMNDRAELDRLMDNHLVELHKEKLSVRNQWIIASLIIIFLLLVFSLITSYFWRDSIRKKKYMALQQRLMENRAEVMLLDEISESTIDFKSTELYRLEEERFIICKSLFETTEGYKRLKELIAATPKVRVINTGTYRKMIVNDLRKTFADAMGDLKEHCNTLTNDDMLYCILLQLHYPKDIILGIMDVTADAIKTRKNRIKNKIDIELFNKIFGS